MNYTANIAISGQIDKKLSKNTKNICIYVFFLPTFAILFNEREEVHKISEGSIAQLVQSVCLTSRGSGVRLPLLPPNEKRLCSNLQRRFSLHSPLAREVHSEWHRYRRTFR